LAHEMWAPMVAWSDRSAGFMSESLDRACAALVRGDLSGTYAAVSR
jgi:hypothetical protein